MPCLCQSRQGDDQSYKRKEKTNPLKKDKKWWKKQSILLAIKFQKAKWQPSSSSYLQQQWSPSRYVKARIELYQTGKVKKTVFERKS